MADTHLYAMVDRAGEYVVSDDGRLFVYNDLTFVRADAKSCGYKLVRVKLLLDRSTGKGIRGSK